MAYGDLSIDAPEKPNKGQEGGACNRRACQAEPALWWNHGSHSWYCEDCKQDIGGDIVNMWEWDTRWLPTCGHPQFETREMMDARQGDTKLGRRESYVLGVGRISFDPPLKRPAGEMACKFTATAPLPPNWPYPDTTGMSRQQRRWVERKGR
jgi:hypothetical protein